MTYKKNKKYGKTLVRKKMTEEDYRLAQRVVNIPREDQIKYPAIFEAPYPKVSEVLE